MKERNKDPNDGVRIRSSAEYKISERSSNEFRSPKSGGEGNTFSRAGDPNSLTRSGEGSPERLSESSVR